MTALLAAIALASQEAMVTFTHPAAPVEAVVTKLGERLGEKLDLEKRFHGSEMYVNVTDVPAEDLLSRVAEVLGGEWKEQADGRILKLDPRHAEQDLAERVKDLEQMLGPRLTSELTETDYRKLAAAAEAEPDEKSSLKRPAGWAALEASPIRRLLKRLAYVAGLRRIASVPSGERLAFVRSPGRWQSGLGAGVDAALACFNREVSAAMKVAESLMADSRIPDIAVIMWAGENRTGPVLDATLEVFGSGLPQLTMRTVHASGRREELRFPGLMEPEPPGIIDVPELQDPGEPAELLIQAMTPRRLSDPLRAALLAEWADPANTLLPGAVISERLDRAAIQGDRDIVASFQVFDPLYLTNPAALPIGDPFRTLQRFSTLRVESSGSWLTVRPGPGRKAAVPLAREGIGQASRMIADGHLTLDEAAALTRYPFRPQEFTSLFPPIAALCPATSSSNTVGQRYIVPIFAALSDFDRGRARAGGVEFKCAGLPAKLKAAVEAWLRGPRPAISSTAPTRDPIDPDEALRDGLPADGVLWIDVTSREDVVQFTDTPRGSVMHAVTPDAIARHVARAEAGVRDVSATAFAALGVERATVRIWTPAWSTTAEADFMPYRWPEDRTTLAGLPQQWRDEVAKLLPDQRAAAAQESDRQRRIKP